MVEVIENNAQSAVQSSARGAEFWSGVKDTFPLVVGAIPFGIIFGALGVNSGLSLGSTMAMSLFVFAGSAQFIAVNLLHQGIAYSVIILTTFIVNLRHALYSATLAPHMKHLSQGWLLPLGFWLTDETFAVVSTHYSKPDSSPYKHWYFLGSAVFMYLNWNLCTFIGASAGQVIPRNLGLDFAAVVTFIGIVVLSIKNRAMIIAVIVAGVFSIIARPLPNGLGLIVAALIGVGAGVLTESLTRKPA